MEESPLSALQSLPLPPKPPRRTGRHPGVHRSGHNHYRAAAERLFGDRPAPDPPAPPDVSAAVRDLAALSAALRRHPDGSAAAWLGELILLVGGAAWEAARRADPGRLAGLAAAVRGFTRGQDAGGRS